MATGLSDLGAQRDRVLLAVRQLGLWRLCATAIVLTLSLLLARYSWQMPLLAEAERALYDFRLIAAAEKVEPDERIVQVVYTDDTLAATGKRSPLDRTILAKALTRIDGMGAKAIGIDVLIDQPQPEDPIIAEAFRNMKTPVFLAYASAETATDKILPWQQDFLNSFQASLKPGPVRPTSIVITTDADNVLRSWPTRNPDDPPLMPNALNPGATSFKDYQRSVIYRLPKFADRPVFSAIPIDTFAEDILFENPEAAALFTSQIEGRYVLIGGHIQDIDLFETPMNRLTGKPTWGVEIFAHMLAQMLDNDRPAAIPRWATWLTAVLVVLAGALTALSNVRPWAVAFMLVGQFTFFAALPFWLQGNGVDTQNLPVFGWAVGWFVAFASVGSAARAVGSEQRKYAQSALGKYLPRDIAAEILRDPDSLALSGEKREIFVVFTDLEGFTQLSHAIEPEMVAQLLNRYLEMLSNVVLEHGGTIDKFVGDAVVAFWGAPISRLDDGERAVRAAVAMHLAGEEFRNTAPEGVPKIGRTRVGLHFGEAIVGNFGGEGRIQYTALGDSMNTASRLESANKQMKSSVLVSREAMERSGLDWFRPMGKVVLRGRARPVEVFEPVPDMNEDDRREFATLAESAMAGDVTAVTALRNRSAINPEDAALDNFVYRLSHQDEGGYFVLD